MLTVLNRITYIILTPCSTVLYTSVGHKFIDWLIKLGAYKRINYHPMAFIILIMHVMPQD